MEEGGLLLVMTISCKSGHRVPAQANWSLLYDWTGHNRVSVWGRVKWPKISIPNLRVAQIKENFTDKSN